MSNKTLLLIGAAAVVAALLLAARRHAAPAVAAAVAKNKADAIAPAERLSIDVDVGEVVLKAE